MLLIWRKRGRVHEFKDEQDQKFFGVCVDRTANELIAIHFKEQFGDGIYYRQMPNGEDVYFLVIHQGCIVSGTDKLINQKMLESVLPLFQQRFPELEVKNSQRLTLMRWLMLRMNESKPHYAVSENG